MLAKLISVDEEVKRLQQEVYDAEWEGDPRLVRLTEELNEWKGLQKMESFSSQIFKNCNPNN